MVPAMVSFTGPRLVSGSSPDISPSGLVDLQANRDKRAQENRQKHQTNDERVRHRQDMAPQAA